MIDAAVEEQLRRRYAEPGRHYHGQAHIDACLLSFELLCASFNDPAAVELAIWFHDAIYDPKANDNEDRSASLAVSTLVAHDAPADAIAKVRDLILATKHNAVPKDTDARLLVDIDLAILGADDATFDAYERAIRQEYAHIPDAAFRTGRTKVLEHFLARERIYATEAFQLRFESAARRNLQRSIAQLSRV